MQAERDGTCKSRALAALGWLLRLDEKALDWYVESTREMFLVELRARQKVRRGMLRCADESLDPESEGEEEEIFGSLMSTGRRDKFGRTMHMKVCHANTARYNHLVDQGCSVTTRGRCLPDQQGAGALLPSDSPEASLRRRREAEVQRIRQVAAREQRGGPGAAAPAEPPPGAPAGAPGAGGAPLGPEQRWRAIEDHEARWHFLETTCFFGHNIGFRKIKKLYARDEVLASQARGGEAAPALADGPAAPRGDGLGFGDTKYLRKYTVGGANYVTHEADPIFQEPVENFLGFLSGDRDETITLPFYALPFPSCFQAVALKDYVKGRTLALDLEGDFDEHVQKQVSDFSIPSGNIFVAGGFLNDPSSYNRASASVSAPVRLRAP
ncbi:unnamed protein product [Prorocentrum cordatum]|uniref:Uncharacterized protein n=1 Tax=Prorocentrum cordatum TaxID=2364126 RepID=A0ABN9SLQ4_9DINO|nr:unnamed protein product [Polarella glacialis]